MSEIIDIGIKDAAIELQPLHGDLNGGVMHMLPGGKANPEWFGGDILDVYAFFAKEKNMLRGGHYHPKLQEMFFTVSGTALWILSDFRKDSETKGVTKAFILGWSAPESCHEIPTYVITETQKPTSAKATAGRLARLRVPAGVYHAIAPLTDEGFTAVALGTTGYDKEDYRYPEISDVPGMQDILNTFAITG